MRAFQFTLQSLFPLREHAEQEAMQHYALALKEQRSAEEQLQQASMLLERACAEWPTAALGGVPAADFCQLARHCQTLADRRTQRHVKLTEAKAKAHSELKKMLYARQKREVLEKLRSKHKQAYDGLVRRLDQKADDERAQRSAGVSPAFGGRWAPTVTPADSCSDHDS